MDVPAAVVKTLVMMAGEIEYENFIYENGEVLYPITGHTMILIFTVLVSIILMNLLVGLAVSDIQVGQQCYGSIETVLLKCVLEGCIAKRWHSFFSFFTTSTHTVLYYLLQQMALLIFFYHHAAASACFKPKSVELHRDPGPFEGCSTD